MTLLNPDDKRLTLRDLLRFAVDNPDADLDMPLYHVHEDKMRDEYVDDSPEPDISYDPNSWLELRRVQLDSESSFESVILLVSQPQVSGLNDDDATDPA